TGHRPPFFPFHFLLLPYRTLSTRFLILNARVRSIDVLQRRITPPSRSSVISKSPRRLGDHCYGREVSLFQRPNIFAVPFLAGMADVEFVVKLVHDHFHRDQAIKTRHFGVKPRPVSLPDLVWINSIKSRDKAFRS